MIFSSIKYVFDDRSMKHSNLILLNLKRRIYCTSLMERRFSIDRHLILLNQYDDIVNNMHLTKSFIQTRDIGIWFAV